MVKNGAHDRCEPCSGSGAHFAQMGLTKHTPSKLVAYAGMDATGRVSRESLDSPGHLSKRGSSYLR